MFCIDFVCLFVVVAFFNLDYNASHRVPMKQVTILVEN